tara:strand:+ start:417 stop:1124 length:708 start_codon:yes stop_codon:yes gene_type:complete
MPSRTKIQIFADGADIKSIKKYNVKSKIKGFTTNPSLMRSNNIKNYIIFAKKILKIVKKKSVSFEIFADDKKTIIEQANQINSWGSNVYVKVPYYNSRGRNNLKIIKILSDKGVKLNITAIFQIKQIKNILKNINKNTRSILSIFAGRIADTGIDPREIIYKSVKLTKKNRNIEILWASCRELYSIKEAEKLGCHIITVPNSILSKMNLFGKDLKKYSIETSKQFFEDSKGINFD